MANSFLPSKDRIFLENKGYSFREVSDGAAKGLIIDGFPVRPEGKFTVDRSSLLIILPMGYPDVPPDMFFFLPELKFLGTNSYPVKADQKPTHFQQVWQQWSRHAPASEWRVGKDGIQSYLQRVIAALNTAV
jgi:hypothetical protein